MKRLLSILFMNAWGGLRRKAALPTMTMVGTCVVVLLVLTTVTVTAAPQTTSLPAKVASIVHTVSDPITSMFSNTPSPKSAPVKPKAKSSPQPASNTPNNSPTTGTSGTASSQSTSNSGSQSGTQAATVTLNQSSLQCTQNQPTANTYTINVSGAQLVFGASPSAGGTVSYGWDVRMDSGPNAGQVTTDAISGTQSFNADQSNVPISSQPLPQSITSSTNNYSFRLYITGPVDAYSSWYSVSTQTTDGSCPQISLSSNQ